MIGTLIVAEFRKTLSTKIWWALLVPAALVSGLVNLLGLALSADRGRSTLGVDENLILLSMATALSVTGIFAVVFGIVSVAGEFRHRTITTTYLTAGSRGAVLIAKAIFAGIVGLLFGLVTELIGLPAALLAQGGAGLDASGDLLTLLVVGLVVVAAWGVLGALLGSLISNLLAAVIGALVYLLVVEQLIQAIFAAAGAPLLGQLLPGEAPGAALLAIAFGDFRSSVDLPPWGISLAVFAGYTALVGVAGWLVSRARDIT